MNKKVAVIIVLVVVFVIGYFVMSTAQKEAGETLIDSVAVQSDIVGVWASVQDAKFIREFKRDNTFIDSYDADASFGGTWKLFTSAAPEKVDVALEAGATYVQLVTTEEGESLALTFKVSKLTDTELELVYIERGGTLTFARVR